MLQQERNKRTRPALDDKILADWNGLMIAALAHGALAFGAPEWLDIAGAAFDFVTLSMSQGDRLGHSWRQGKLLLPGLASDYAAMIRAALALFEATGEQPFLDTAIRWQRSLDKHYADGEHGAYYLTTDDAEVLIIRPRQRFGEAVRRCGRTHRITSGRRRSICAPAKADRRSATAIPIAGHGVWLPPAPAPCRPGAPGSSAF
jgi:uncharacterized protein YyaL (SSP411 family)